MTTRILPSAPCHWVDLGEPHDPHDRTVRVDRDGLHLVTRRHCPGVPDREYPADTVGVWAAAGHTLDEMAAGHSFIVTSEAQDPTVPFLVRHLQFPNLTQAVRFAGIFDPGAHADVWIEPTSRGTALFDEPVTLVVIFREEQRPAVPVANPFAGIDENTEYEATGDILARPATAPATREDPFRRATDAQERAREEADAARVPTRRAPAEEGMYRKDGVIYKVQLAVHGSGKPYAKELVLQSSETPNWKFEYAPGVVRELGPEHKLTLEQAKEFGQRYGTCCVCGRVLTNEESIAAGIGPVCAGRL